MFVCLQNCYKRYSDNLSSAAGVHKMFFYLGTPIVQQCQILYVGYIIRIKHSLCLGQCACQFLQCAWKNVPTFLHLVNPFSTVIAVPVNAQLNEYGTAFEPHKIVWNLFWDKRNESQNFKRLRYPLGLRVIHLKCMARPTTWQFIVIIYLAVTMHA